MRTDLPVAIQKILYPTRLVSRAEIIADPSLVPATSGIYGWYFDQCLAILSDRFLVGCHKYEGKTLLYIGIAPEEPIEGKRPSNATLNSRIVGQHCNGDAEGSTLRFSLGCLLANQLGIQLRLRGTSKRFAIGDACRGEERLSEWMSHHAFVSFVEIWNPWELEKQILGKPLILSLPLNLKGNSNHPFCKFLKGIRKEAKNLASKLPPI